MSMTLSANKIINIWKTTYETIVQIELAIKNGSSSILSNKFYVLSQGKDMQQMDYLSSDCNRDALMLGDEIFHNMYDMDDVWYHNQAARKHRYPYATQHDYQHIYRRPNDQLSSRNGIDQQLHNICKTNISSIACAGNVFYGIDRFSTFGHSFVNDEMYKWLLNDNGWSQPPAKNIIVNLYTTKQGQDLVDEISNSNNEAIAGSKDYLLSSRYFSEDQISALSSTNGIYTLSGIVGMEWNTIYEIPGNIKQDYSKGELIANTFKAKNQFDGNTWSMNHDSNAILQNAREYLGIYSCGEQIWLKWKDNKQWKASTSQLNTYPDIYGRTIVSGPPTNVLPTIPFPQIETFAAINRGIQAPAHKSTLYSLKLQTKLPQKLSKELDSSIKDEIKDKLKLELQVCMRKISEKIAPANCQLFSAIIDC